MLLQLLKGHHYSYPKLDNSQQAQFLIFNKITFDNLNKVVDVKENIDKNEEGFYSQLIDRNQAGVAVMHDEIAAQSPGLLVLDAACPESLLHINDSAACCEFCQNVWDGAGKHLKALRELEEYRDEPPQFILNFQNSEDCLLNFKIIIAGENPNCFFQQLVVPNLIRNLVE